jgi:GT2 family glycosyltransferase
MTPRRVAAVVLTYKRTTVLAETLRAISAQTRAPDRIYVVDNAGDESTATLLRGDFPDALHMQTGENLGTGGRTYGMQAAQADGFDAFWLVDDDSPPHPDALEALLAATGHSSGRVGVVGSRGGVVRFGLILHVEDMQQLIRRRMGTDLFSVDFVLLDGSLILRRAVEAVGLPRVDYFIMLEDVEYPLRVRRAGLDVLLIGRDLMRRQYLGSTPGSGPWRSYYQSRNHLRMALDFRSPSLLVGWIARQAWFMLAAIRAPHHRSQRIRLRLRGAWDALRGRMGRRVEPE